MALNTPLIAPRKAAMSIVLVILGVPLVAVEILQIGQVTLQVAGVTLRGAEGVVVGIKKFARYSNSDHFYN